MKLTNEQKQLIRSRWESLSGKQDLLDLLNDVKKLIYEKPRPFALKQLTYYANPRLGGRRYVAFELSKKSGGFRKINAPVAGLKILQSCLNLIFQCLYPAHKNSFGFVPSKSIVDNAKKHINSNYVYNIDLKDFFSSVDQARVWKCLQLPPFHLNDEKTSQLADTEFLRPGFFDFTTPQGEWIFYKISKNKHYLSLHEDDGDIISLRKRLEAEAEQKNVGTDTLIYEMIIEKLKKDIKKGREKEGRRILANMIAAICCTSLEVERTNPDSTVVKVLKNVLPQGAPTSPFLTNVVCQRLDHLLSGMAKRFGCRYSRYADDITFSSSHNIYHKDGDFEKELRRIITSQGFQIKESKTRLQKRGFRQEVTGIVVNEKENVRVRYLKELRKWLYLWERYGYEKASSFFINDYVKDRGHVNNGALPEMYQVVKGKLDYLQMVKGVDNGATKKLLERFSRVAEIFAPKKRVPELRGNEKVVHKPIDTVNFLKFFKYDSKFLFKQLVHKPVDEKSFDFIYVLNTAEKEFSEWINLEDNKIKLPKDVIEGVRTLITMLRTQGIEYFKKTGHHPYEQEDVHVAIQNFKQNYRFGNEHAESTILSDYIRDIASKTIYNDSFSHKIKSFNSKDTSGQFSLDQISFEPEILKFQLRANFFTWVPNVGKAIKEIFLDILQHSNCNGDKGFNRADKKILVSVERYSDEEDRRKVDLIIHDKNSILLSDPEKLIESLRDKFTKHLIGICNYRVEADYDGKAAQFVVFPYAKHYSLLPSPVHGFKHIFTFFD
jgi:hypothetical protein